MEKQWDPDISREGDQWIASPMPKTVRTELIHLGTKIWRSCKNIIFFFYYGTVFERESVIASIALSCLNEKTTAVEYSEFISSLPPGNWMVF